MKKLVTLLSVLFALTACSNSNLNRFGATTTWANDIKSIDQTWILNYDSVYLTSRFKGEESENYAVLFADASCKDYFSNKTIQALTKSNYFKPLLCSNNRDQLQGKVLTIEQEYVIGFFDSEKGITVSVYDDNKIHDRRNFGLAGGDPKLWQSQLILRTIFATRQKAEKEGKLSEWEALMATL